MRCDGSSRKPSFAGNPDREPQAREYLATASFAEVVPAFGRFFISVEGHIWVEEYRVERAPFGFRPEPSPRTTPVRWRIYDPDGILLGDVEVPLDLTVSEIGADYVLGVARDELEVETVRMYSIVKP